MSTEQPTPTITPGAEPAGSLHDRQLPLMRAAWLILAGLTAAVFVAVTPALLAQMAQPCTASPCFGWRLTADDARLLQRQGLSMGFFAVYGLALNTLFVLSFLGVAVLIMWRRGRDRAAVLMALVLTLFGAGEVVSQLSTVWGIPDALWSAVLSLSSVLLFFLFPSGKFVPRWARWLAIAVPAWVLSELLLPDWSQAVAGVVQLGIYLVGIGAQVYRYRRVSTTLEREQTKWAVFGIALAIIGFSSLSVVGGLFPQTTTLSGGAVYLAINAAWPLCYSLIPLSIGVAILRSRLYDIDILINRTLIYGALTALLGLTYWGTVFLLQTALRPLTGANNELAIVVSTLVIAGLFLPLRRRLQSFIDRRFYRRKYDAAQTLAGFSATLRDEVDLNSLSVRLIEVVEDTMQPAQVSLWLRQPEHEHQLGRKPAS